MAPLSYANHITADFGITVLPDLKVYMVVLVSIDSWTLKTR